MARGNGAVRARSARWPVPSAVSGPARGEIQVATRVGVSVLLRSWLGYEAVRRRRRRRERSRPLRVASPLRSERKPDAPAERRADTLEPGFADWTTFGELSAARTQE